MLSPDTTASIRLLITTSPPSDQHSHVYAPGVACRYGNLVVVIATLMITHLTYISMCKCFRRSASKLIAFTLLFSYLEV